MPTKTRKARAAGPETETAAAAPAAPAAAAAPAAPARKRSSRPAAKKTSPRQAAPAVAAAETAAGRSKAVAAKPKAAAAKPKAAAAGPKAPAPRKTSRRTPRGPATATAPAAAAPAPAVPPTAATAAAQARIRRPDDDAVFGRYLVQLPDEEDAEVRLRSAYPGTGWCSCLDFALSEHGDCPHLRAVMAAVQADPARAEALARGPQRVASRVELLQGARRRLLWLPGLECPASLSDLADEVLGVPPEALDDQALPRLLRAAREAGHELQVDEAVWTHLATGRDARWRVQRLQQRLPEGPLSAELAALLPLQAEGALFAVCAGRCLLADCAELQPWQQALAAIGLWQRHFGVERVLILAPAERLGRWRQALAASAGDAADCSLMALDSVAADAARHAMLAPELVIIDEPEAGGLWVDAERAAALLRLPAAQAIVLPPADWLARPAELPLRLAFVDDQRLGAYAALLDRHGQRDAEGQLCGLQDLQALPATLAPVLLARSLDEVRSQLPEKLEHERTVPLPAVEAAQQAALQAALRATLQRWQRCDWLPDAAQRPLYEQVQALRRWCAGDGAPAVAAAKADAVLALLAASAAPLVVFSQWPGALAALQSHLQAAGVSCAQWSAQDSAAARQAAAKRFDDGALRVLCVADPGSSALELHRADAAVLHLDLPWHPRTLSRRFGRVHRRGKAQLVPVWQLLLAGSFEQALAASAAQRPQPVTEWLDANAAEGFLQGEALAACLAGLAQVLQLEPATAAGANA